MTDPALPRTAPAARRLERIFAWVAVFLAAVLLAGALPGWFVFKGYRRARWADRRGIVLVVRARFDGFGCSLRGSTPDSRGQGLEMDMTAYRQLQQPGFLEKEAGGEFWSAFYGMGTRLYQRAAGSRLPPARSPGELRMTERLDEARARKKAEAERRRSEHLAGLIGRLGAEDWRRREAASAEILKIGRPALPALYAAARSPDAEIANRARNLIAKIRP